MCNPSVVWLCRHCYHSQHVHSSHRSHISRAATYTHTINHRSHISWATTYTHTIKHRSHISRAATYTHTIKHRSHIPRVMSPRSALQVWLEPMNVSLITLIAFQPVEMNIFANKVKGLPMVHAYCLHVPNSGECSFTRVDGMEIWFSYT